MSSILVITPDWLGPAMAGPAIRAHRIGRELAAIGHDVELLSAVGVEPGWPEGAEVMAVGFAEDHRVRRSLARADVVVVQGDVLDRFGSIARSDVPVVVDLYDPGHMEELERVGGLPDAEAFQRLRVVLTRLAASLARGDLFLCASERQRYLWLGHLGAAGRLNPLTQRHDPELRGLLRTVPFGVDPPPQRTGPAIRGVIPGIGDDELIVLWGGGIYDWFDPLTLIRAIARLRVSVPEIRLFFLGLRHPNPSVEPMAMSARAERLADELGVLDSHVVFNERWVEHDDRAGYFLDSNVGVTTHVEHLETAFSYRTRVLDYLWAGLPVVATEGDHLAALVSERGAGRVVAPSDVEGLASAIGELLTDPAAAAVCSAAAAGLADELRWPLVVAPLAEFCAAPRRAPDLDDRIGRAFVESFSGGWRGAGRRSVNELARLAGRVEELGPRATFETISARTRRLLGH